ncbi:Hint domain-containing protein [Acetobacter conturbans]|uniref:Hint domain-containing protein n=1 Tax=Acetobacter conturbans TaxID=1737472 RepID=UPI001568B469
MTTISSGVSSSNVSATSSDPLVVASGGSVTTVTIGQGASATISGTASDVTVSNGGSITVASSGVVSTITLQPKSTEYVSKGGKTVSSYVDSGSTLTVYTGGSAVSTTVTGQGLVNISAGGAASGVVLNDGWLAIYPTGSAADITVNSGNPNATMTYASVQITGVGLYVAGTVSNVIINSGGVANYVYYQSQGVGKNTIVNSGGILREQGGVSIDAVLEGGAEEIVYYSYYTGSSISTTISSGAHQYVSLGVASGAIVSAGGYQIVSGKGGRAVGTEVLSGGTATVSTSGVVSGASVASGGMLAVSATGVASGGVVASGGKLAVAAGGTVSAVDIDGGTLVLAGSGALATGTLLENQGRISVANSAILSGGTYTSGTIIVSSGGHLSNTSLGAGASAVIGSGGQAGGMNLASGASLSVGSGGTVSSTTVSSGAVVEAASGAIVSSTLLSSGGLLQIDSGATTTDTTLVSGGAIELVGTTWSDTDALEFDSATNTLYITDNGVTLAVIDLASADDIYSSADFTISETSADALYASPNDVLVTLTVAACFCRGTLIETEFGPMAIETIEAGTRVLTVGGRFMPVRWRGVRRYTHKQMVLDRSLCPVRLRAHALADDVPRRDLRLSQLHALYLLELLLPANALVNGSSIFLEPPSRYVEYHHIDLGVHAVILAENTPAETLLDDDAARRSFDNYASRCPKDCETCVAPVYCAPLIERGEVVRRLQKLYAQRAKILDFPEVRLEVEDFYLV